MGFGTRLRTVRLIRGYTQQKMSDMIGVALRTYQCYEQGKREPNYTTLIKIAESLNVSTDYLLGLDDKNQ